MGVLAAQVGQDHELNRLELVLPHRVGNREEGVARITLGPADGNVVFPHWPAPPCVCCSPNG